MATTSLADTASALITELSNLVSELKDTTHPTGSPETRFKLAPLLSTFHQQLQGPHLFLRNYVSTIYEFAALNAALELEIFTKLPATIQDLSNETKVDGPTLLRLIRLLATVGIFAEEKDGTIIHSSLSRVLAEDYPLRALAGMQMDEAIKSCTEMGAALKSGTSAFEQRFEQSQFKFYASNPEKAKRFAAAMAGTTRVGSSDQLIDQWITSNTSSKNLIIDVGGGSGHLSIHLAKQFPNLTFIVRDQSQEMFSKSTAELESSLAERITFQQQDFFNPQPVDAGVGAYIIKQCLHNWSDEDCGKILRGFIPALQAAPDASILISDSVLRDPGEVPAHVERGLRHLDIAMLVMRGAKQRTAEDWKRLISVASPEFRVVDIKTDYSGLSTLGLVEVKWVKGA